MPFFNRNWLQVLTVSLSISRTFIPAPLLSTILEMYCFTASVTFIVATFVYRSLQCFVQFVTGHQNHSRSNTDRRGPMKTTPLQTGKGRDILPLCFGPIQLSWLRSMVLLLTDQKKMEATLTTNRALPSGSVTSLRQAQVFCVTAFSV